MVSRAIAISDHFTFPNDIAVSVTLTDGYTHRTDTYSNLFSQYWHRCPNKYGYFPIHRENTLNRRRSKAKVRLDLKP